jgi:hypothetical protein
MPFACPIINLASDALALQRLIASAINLRWMYLDVRPQENDKLLRLAE